MDRGILKKCEKKAGNHSGVVKYRNKQGKSCCHGTAKLKESQNLDCKRTPLSRSEICLYPDPDHVSPRRYPARFARLVMDLLPVFRYGPNKIQPEAGHAGLCNYSVAGALMGRGAS